MNILIERFKIGYQLAQVRQHSGCAVGRSTLSHGDLLLMLAHGKHLTVKRCRLTKLLIFHINIPTHLTQSTFGDQKGYGTKVRLGWACPGPPENTLGKCELPPFPTSIAESPS